MNQAQTIADRFERRYGHQSSGTGRLERPINAVSTGVLALDYALGIGGWPLGHIVEVFGPPDIGKSSIFGFNVIREAQAKGMICGLVAVEPGFDPEWAQRHGVDLDRLVIGWPDDGQEAFEMLFDMVQDPDIGYCVFDSIGQVQRPTEVEAGGKASQGGASALISWGIKRVVMPAWKKNKGIMLLNQIRDDMGSRIPGMLRAPGGHVVEHDASIIVQLKPGKERYMAKVDGDDIMVGREVVAVVKRNKLSEGTGHRARFDFYQMEHSDYPYGVDKWKDVLTTAMRLGLIEKAGAWLRHDSFPESGGKRQVQGRNAAEEFLNLNPESAQTIRNEVLEKMRAKSRLPKDESNDE